MGLWSYEEVMLHSIEPYNRYLRGGAKYAYSDGFYLINPDITSRLAVNLPDIREKRRLFYVSEVIREGIRGKWQVGAELFGMDRRRGSLEIISVVMSAMECLGVDDFAIDIGSTAAWDEILDDPEIDGEMISKALARRDQDTLQTLIKDGDRRSRILSMMNARGSPTGMKDLDVLVHDIGDKRVISDPGTVKLLPYYDGFIFEIYSPSSLMMLGSGGSYTIGGIEAVGFALDLSSLAAIHENNSARRSLTLNDADAGKAYNRARQMVRRGISVEVGGQ